MGTAAAQTDPGDEDKFTELGYRKGRRVMTHRDPVWPMNTSARASMIEGQTTGDEAGGVIQQTQVVKKTRSGQTRPYLSIKPDLTALVQKIFLAYISPSK
jgi:hypothetical protein